MHYVYILTSIRNPSRIYIGRTENLKTRLGEHNRGKSIATKKDAPWKLETYIAFSEENLAVKFEKYLKVGSGFAFLKKRFLPSVGDIGVGTGRTFRRQPPAYPRPGTDLPGKAMYHRYA